MNHKVVITVEVETVAFKHANNFAGEAERAVRQVAGLHLRNGWVNAPRITFQVEGPAA